jgi:hypothetical protein
MGSMGSIGSIGSIGSVFLLVLFQSAVISDAESYSVYGTVLATGWPKPGVARSTVVIEGRTAGAPLCTAPGLSGSEWIQAAADYARANAATRLLDPAADLGTPFVLVTTDVYENLLMQAGGDAKKIYDDYGGMSLTVSAVGFDGPAIHAIVTVQSACPSGCEPEQRQFFLQKAASGWKIAGSC